MPQYFQNMICVSEIQNNLLYIWQGIVEYKWM